MTLTPIGLCPFCRYIKVIKSARGSIFVLCNRAKFDDRFSKYPVLPVLTCAGFIAAEATGAENKPDQSSE
jgi:hypothetical protein